MINLDQFPSEIQGIIREHGEYYFPLWKIILELKETDTDFCWLAGVMHIINFFSCIKDPTPAHFLVSREYLEKNQISDNRAIDTLARELLTFCKKFQEFILNSCPDPGKGEKCIPLILCQEGEYKMPMKDELYGYGWDEEECNLVDFKFSKFLESTGITGKKSAEAIRSNSKERLMVFKKSGYEAEFRPLVWSLWLNKKDDTPSIISPYLKILVDVVWQDLIQNQLEKEKKYRPAIPSGYWTQTIKPVLKKNCRVENSDEQLSIISNDGILLATVKVPFIDQKSLSLINKGIQSFGSLSGHRLLRWEIKSGCQNIITGTHDPRILITEGGYEGIANLIGCGKNKSTVTEVKAILQAQSNVNFRFPNGDKASSLIILHEMEHHRNGEPSKIKILLGDILLPHTLFNLPKGEQRLLIPITDLPPLIGSANTHAAQAMLQLLLLEEFSKQSTRLVEKGSAHIPREKWEFLAKEASLPLSSLQRVIDGWTVADIAGTSFLQRDGEEYTLSKDHADVVAFLEDQGNRRVSGAEAGKKSAKIKADKKMKILKGT